ncbi:MAG: hypothetical protein ABSF00_05580 [Candidatus Bathyarchaeia archaeon]
MASEPDQLCHVWSTDLHELQTVHFWKRLLPDVFYPPLPATIYFAILLRPNTALRKIWVWPWTIGPIREEARTQAGVEWNHYAPKRHHLAGQ